MKTDGTVITWLRLVLAAALALAVGLTTFSSGQLASAADPVVAVDDGGPDDQPGQKDLNSLSVDYGALGATNILVTFNFDDTSTSGANTLDGCALFDTDGDGFANFAQCQTISSDGSQVVSQYRCTADSRADRCAGPEVVTGFASTSTAAIVPGSDPFRGVGSHTSGNTCSTRVACYTDDYVVTANIAVLQDFGGSASLINVCSYPSIQPNSDPSDCVFAANNGFLTIVKTTDQETSQQFVFNASSAASNGRTQFSTIGAGTVSTISYAPTTTLDLAEVIPAEWRLDSASCVIQTSAPSPTGSPTVTGVDDFEIRSGLTTVCTFDNVKRVTSLTLIKEVMNDNGGRAASTEWTLTANGPTPISGAGGATSDNSFEAGTYNLSESAGPTGYRLTSVTCDKTGNAQVTSITVAIGEQVTCTFVNDDVAPSLTLRKEVVNDNGGTAQPGDFTLVAGGYDAASPDAGSYGLSESGPSGYTQTSLTCSNSTGQVTSVSLGLGETVVCTFVNDDNRPGLTLVKNVVNNNGGTALAGDFTLSAAGYDPVSPDAGSYDLSESGPLGYTQTSLMCSNSTGQVTSVRLGLGENVTCTFVNDDDAPSLTLIKNVVNNNGGSAVAADFTLSAEGYDAGNPQTGTYVLSESGPSGYTRVSLTCSNSTGQVTSVTLGLGDDVTCTFVNDDNAPSLTLLKIVTNDNGGTAQPGDFTLVAGGYDAASPDAGSYDLSESGPRGYTQTSLTCSNSTGQVTSVTIGLGETVTCTFVNDDDAPSLTLVKNVVNNNGGTAVAADFTLTAAGYDGSDPQAGTYPLSETGPSGYTRVSLTCTNSTGQVTSITLGLGDDVTCTFVNDDEPVDLQLTKDDGGVTAVAGGAPFDYTISVQNIGTRDIDAGEPVTVTDDLPVGLVWVSFPANCSQAGQVLTCDIDEALLPAGGDPIVITVSVRALANAASGTYVNKASVTTQDDTTTNPPCPATNDNNVDCEPTPVLRTGGVQIIKTDDVANGATVQAGNTYSYSLVVTNTGVSTILPGMVVSDDLPSAIELVSVTGGAGWACNNADPISCTYLPSLAPATSAPGITVTVKVAAGAAGTSISNVAVVNGVVDTNKPVTDDDDETTPLVAQADLAIVKTASVDRVGAGGGFNWILAVTNNGPGTARSVVISDFVPNQLSVTGVSSSDFTCGNNGNNVTCMVDSLAVGASGSITISVTTLASAGGGDVLNVATVAATTPDPNLTNNTSTATVVIVAQAPPDVTLPRTGSDVTKSVTQSAVLLVMLGGTIVLATRRRRGAVAD
ncbi:MAG: hypothetical protein ABIP17_01785 [Ilumatobacteraceae bacterium]